MFKLTAGPTYKTRWGQWYRHDTVLLDGKPLEGFIQVRRRYLGRRFGHRIESITCFRNTCVMGHNVEWLARQQESDQCSIPSPPTLSSS